MAGANQGDAPAYGGDTWTAAFEQRVKEIFGPQAEGFPVINGAGANMVGLGLMLGRYDAIICPDTAHIATHETGAAERLPGVKLVTVATHVRTLRPDALPSRLSGRGARARPQPSAVSFSRTPGRGPCYPPHGTAALAAAAHAAGLRPHIDGARLANAAAFHSCGLAA